MTKVVINACHGGFSLSTEALRLLNNGFPYRYRDWEDGQRHDPELVKVVEQLGAAASGRFGELVVEDIGDAKQYRVCEYDGLEWVETPDTIEWVNV